MALSYTVPTWALVTRAVFFKRTAYAPPDLALWACTTFVFIVLTVVLFLMGYRILPAFFLGNASEADDRGQTGEPGS